MEPTIFSPPSTKPGAIAGSPPAPPLANGNATGGTGNPAPTVPGASSVPLFGGNRGGRARKDGLPPGSEAAKAADRTKDIERKRVARSKAAQMVDPPPLPPALPGVAGAGPTPPDSESALLSASPGAETPVPWDGDMLAEFTDPVIDAAEARRMEKFYNKAAEAKLGDTVAREIRKGAAYPAEAKKGLKLSTPRIAAKLLNKAGISSVWRDEVACASSLTAIVVQGRKLSAKLDELIDLAKKEKEPKP